MKFNLSKNEPRDLFEDGNDKRFTYSFIFLYLALSILLGTDYKISFPLETPFKVLVFLVVALLLIAGVWNLFRVRFINVIVYFACKVRVYSEINSDNKSSAYLSLVGVFSLQLSIYFIESFLFYPFFFLGMLVMVWGGGYDLF